MDEQRQNAEALVATIQLAEAASASIRRCGTQEEEVERRASVRALIRGSRALVRALSQFADGAAAHTDGVHCASRMDDEVRAVKEALTDFVFAARQAAQCNAPMLPSDREVTVPTTGIGSHDTTLGAFHASWLPLRWPPLAKRDDIDVLPPMTDQGHEEVASPPA